MVGVISTLLLHDMFVKNFGAKTREAMKGVKEGESFAVKV
jgi:hypothetical protein